MVDYTPGPWDIIVTQDAIETTICGPVKTTYRADSDRACGQMRAEAIANARLICAAPDLLDVVTRFLAVYMLKSDAQWTDYCTVAEEARAILRKIHAQTTPANLPDPTKPA